MSKRILAALFSIVLVIGMIPFGTFAEKVSEHTYTVPTVGASASSDKPLITVGTIADGHVDYGLQNSDPYLRSSYIKAMNALKAEGVDIILDGGDMVSDNEDQQKVDFRWEKSVYDRVISQYKKYSSAASTTGVTLWACGNHDYEVGRLKEGVFSAGDYNSYEGFQNVMVETAGQPKSLYTEKDDTPNSVNTVTENNWLGAHFNVKGFDFIILNPPYAKSDYYTAGTLNWLDETLAGIGADKTVFIVGHYPLQDSRGPASTSLIKGTNYTNFMYVMKKYRNAIYLFGHIHDSDSGYISGDTFERITHYDKNGSVVSFRSIQPTSFISSFMGSASFYKYSFDPDWLTSAEPKIIQAMTITVYADRIEFKTINCGQKSGASQNPLVYTIQRDVLNGGGAGSDVELKDSWTLPSDILEAPNAKSEHFGLYYMDPKTGELSNNWNGTCGATYINIAGGHGRGTFASASSGGIKVFPEDGKSAVVQFTAPKDGEYVYEVPVSSIATTANKTGNKQIVFSVMKDGVIYNITQPTNKDNYSGTLSGTIKLKKGEKLLFVADWYVKYFNSTMTPSDHMGYWAAGSFNGINIALIDANASAAPAVKKYTFDGSGLKFTQSGYSFKSNDHYSLAAIDKTSKKLLSLERGETAIYGGTAGAAIYKGKSGNVTIAYHYSNGNLMFGPYGAGNANKSIASAIVFTAPQNGQYNLNALLLHDWDYNATTQKNYAMTYEILDSDLNVIFSGSTANVFTGSNVQGTISRAAGSVYLDKGEKVYLSFSAAPEATVTDSDTISMRVLSLDAALVSSECEHKWTNGTCSSCGATCKHSYGNDNICDICGYKNTAATTPGTTTKPSDTTDPDVTPGDTTVPDTTDPDSDSTTKPNDTTVPDVTDPNDDGKGGDGDKGDNQAVVWIIVIVAVVVIAGVVTAIIIKKKKA